MESRPVRKRYRDQKFQTRPAFFMRLWFTSSNSYSETIYVNSTQLYKYSEAQKENFCNGSAIKLRVNNEDISAVVLARGSFEEMERLTPDLEDMAAMNYDTDDVVRKIEEKTLNTKKLGLAERQNADTDSHSDVDCDKEIAKEKKKLKLIKTTRMRGGNVGCFTSKSSNERPEQSTSTGSTEKATTSQLILVELRVQTTALRQLSFNMRELVKSLQSLTGGSDRNIPKVDKEFEGYEGPFNLSSISSQSPNVFARNFLRKRHPVEFLHNRILCPLGKTDKQALPEVDSKALQEALMSWYGPEYSWRSVTLSVNQFLREIKLDSTTSSK